MAIKYDFNIPRPQKPELKFTLETGRSMIIIGANGSGKTRLGVHIEHLLSGKPVQRIAAQKLLTMSDAIDLVSLERAEKGLFFGHHDGNAGQKAGLRWQGKPATAMLNDFHFLLQTLFAEHNRAAGRFLKDFKLNPSTIAPQAKIEHLKKIWDDLLPHRVLEIRDASVVVIPTSSTTSDPGVYPASEMSDGERAIFYFIGQCLVAPENAVIIVDEPESHVHKGILASLWDAIEKARPDCGFIYITHDVDFVSVCSTADKYYIRSFIDTPPAWDIEELPKDTGLPEALVAELVGSRKPILFVEGDRGSLDLTLYRSRYPEFTIEPVGSCETVIHCVATYRGNASLHWLNAHGLVDADQRNNADIVYLQTRNVAVLPVAEVESLLLWPDVFLALARALQCPDPSARLEALKSDVFKDASNQLEQVSARYTTRQLDQRLKRVGIAAKNLPTLQAAYKKELSEIDPVAIFYDFRTELEKRIQARDLPGVLAIFDNKGGLSGRAASNLGVKNSAELFEKVGHLLTGEQGEEVRAALKKILPSIPI